jgi:hypothetical protein
LANERIYCISDPHFPYHHPQSFDFHEAVKQKYNPDRIICLGDELDHHRGSFHIPEPELPSWEDELVKGLSCIKSLEQIFPRMDLLESNHGSLWFRQAKAAGLPRRLLKTYEQVLETKRWKWHFDLTIRMPDRKYVYFHHARSVNCLLTSKNMGMSAVQGHHHHLFSIQYWGNELALNWAMQLPCMADKDSLAQSYGKNNLQRPIVGCGIILHGQPRLLPMVLDKRGIWDGRIH